MKILVTGSRKWDKPEIVFAELRKYAHLKPSIIVGDCPTGVDNMVRKFCYQYDWPISIYEADWKKYGRAAGPLRNKAMVLAEPDLCLAFRVPGSKGTQSCINIAQQYKVETIITEYPDE